MCLCGIARFRGSVTWLESPWLSRWWGSQRSLALAGLRFRRCAGTCGVLTVSGETVSVSNLKGPGRTAPQNCQCPGSWHPFLSGEVKDVPSPADGMKMQRTVNTPVRLGIWERSPTSSPSSRTDPHVTTHFWSWWPLVPIGLRHSGPCHSAVRVSCLPRLTDGRGPWFSWHCPSTPSVVTCCPLSPLGWRWALCPLALLPTLDHGYPGAQAREGQEMAMRYTVKLRNFEFGDLRSWGSNSGCTHARQVLTAEQHHRSLMPCSPGPTVSLAIGQPICRGPVAGSHADWSPSPPSPHSWPWG